MTSGEWDGRGNSEFFVGIMLLIIFVGGYLIFNWMSAPSYAMDELCIDNGFEEATDYKRSNNNTLIECDEKEIFNTTTIVECYKPDKWGECNVMQIKGYFVEEKLE